MDLRALAELELWEPPDGPDPVELSLDDELSAVDELDEPSEDESELDEEGEDDAEPARAARVSVT